MNKVVPFEVTFKLRFQNLDFFGLFSKEHSSNQSVTTRYFIVAYNCALLD